MLNFIYWITGIVITIIFSYKAYRYIHMKQINNVKIQQNGEKLTDVTGADFKLTNGDDLHIENMKISQNAKEMKNVTGLSFRAEGKQSVRLQGIEVKQPGAKIVISDNPNVKVIINKHD